MPITLISASLLALLLVYLSYDVTKHRRRSKTSLGDGGDAELTTAIRAQANLVEYAPIGLILIGLLEQSMVSSTLVAGLAAVLVIGRFMHGLTLGKFEGPSIYRVISTASTWLVLLVAGILGLIEAAALL